MDKQRWKTIGSIVDEALNLPQEEWRMFIGRECGSDYKLRKEVEKLLESIQASEGLWDQLIHSHKAIAEDYSRTLSHLNSDSYISQFQFQIGPYQLKECIGKGGMGDVYRAKRADGQYSQTVAVKLMRASVGLQDSYHRFRQERQILASLDHPNIARLFDGGLTDDGRPYLVMEYVEGLPVTEFCKKNHCSLEQRLELFGQVCRAVQYAHRNLVVHRDLKPDNILVTEEGSLKVLDFGIAKLLDTELTDRTLIETRPGQRMMSLHYAAPEQITMEPVTTATDVYALGLLLYELLAGARPFELKGKRLAEAEQVIRHRDPVKPSLQASRWRKQLKGDLDAIILKALRKEPEQRYESAGQLLEDLRRHQQNLPVLARSDTLRYRATKFLKRHRAGIAATAGVLLLTAVFSFYHARQITAERNIARSEAEKTSQINTFLTRLFESADPEIAQGKEISVRDLLETGRQQILSLNDQPDVQAELLRTIGKAYGGLGYYQEALELLEQALALHREQNGNRSAEAASLLFDIGILHKDRRDFETAISYLQQAAQIRQAQWPKKPVETAITLVSLSEAMTQEGQIDSSKYYMEEGLSLLRKNLPPYHEYILRAKTGLAMIYRHEQNYTEAISLLKENIDALRSEAPSDLTALIPNLNNLGYVQKLNKNYAAAEAAYREAIELGIKVFGEDHLTVMMMRSNNLVSVLVNQRKFMEAESLLLQSLELHRSRYGTDHWRTGSAMNSLALFYLKSGSNTKALPYFDETIALYRKVLGPGHTWTGRVIAEKSLCLQAMGEEEEATRQFNKGFEIIMATRERINYNEKRDIDRLACLFEQTGDSTRADRIREFLKEIGYPSK